ncbi:SGNH/GDSL hydrolase family protein [Pseudomaricurvus sp.]|uniref:SGNH/GDSL hydrolase family protein n=1 Tax=Pseudomaricurvus sp. TaxID=2004510 RepID=UPI003F6B295B
MQIQFIKKLALLTAATCFSFGVSAGSLSGSSDADKMIIGDSIFALSGDIHAYLEDDLNEGIDTHARSGCQMNGGNILCSSRYNVPNQYDDASKRGIETVIMNGGGNDFLLGDGGDCTTQACTQEVLFAIEETISGLVADMRNDGITEIVYLGYYYVGTEDDAVNQASMDYKAANYPAMGIKFVDSRNAFLGNESAYISSDGIHPTAAGSRVLATLIENALD